MPTQNYVNVRVFKVMADSTMALVAGVDTGSQLDTAIFDGRAWGVFAGEGAELIEGNMDLIRDYDEDYPENSTLPEITSTSIGNVYGDIGGSPSNFIGEYVVVALSYPPPQQIVELVVAQDLTGDGYIGVTATYEPLGEPIQLLMGVSPTNPLVNAPLQYFWTNLVDVTQ